MIKPCLVLAFGLFLSGTLNAQDQAVDSELALTQPAKKIKDGEITADEKKKFKIKR